jgi:hypothetical protein
VPIVHLFAARRKDSFVAQDVEVVVHGFEMLTIKVVLLGAASARLVEAPTDRP